ncbi:pre-mRNA-splicing factor SLT11 [Trichomonascus vanleenenianus]|uniref:Pre-mRNA-splicing factor ECM2 n=1 Tax=Trichomonascus vanleenenianus TaxID=2268995 RepID=UPI003ECAB911
MEENENVPVVCDRCFGDNPYLDIKREKNGEQCKLCSQIFTLFVWYPERKGRARRTVICQACARLKNCCQSCMLDLAYGLPIALRDQALKMVENAVPTGEQNVILHQRNVVGRLKDDELPEEYSHQDEKARELLRKLAKGMGRSSSSQSSGLTKKEMELEEDKALTGDISKIVSKLPFNAGVKNPPKDESIASLFIYGIEDDLPDSELRKYFSPFGAIKALVVVHRAMCGFVTFETRVSAEAAAASLDQETGAFVAGGNKLRAAWSKPRQLGTTSDQQARIAIYAKKAIRGKLKKVSKKKDHKPTTATATAKAAGSSSAGAGDIDYEV